MKQKIARGKKTGFRGHMDREARFRLIGQSGDYFLPFFFLAPFFAGWAGVSKGAGSTLGAAAA